MKIVLVWFFFAFFLLLLPGSAYAATLYVATTGNDANPGASNAPWRTILKGVQTMKGGDTLIVKPGVYEESLTQDSDDITKRGKIPSGLSPNQPTIVKSEIKHGAIMRPKDGRFIITLGGSGAKNAQGQLFSADKYITIDGFVLDGVNIRNDVVRISGASDTDPRIQMTSWQDAQPSHISIINNHIKNASGYWRRIETSTIDYNSPIDVTGSSGGSGSATQANYHPYGMGISASHVNYILYANNILENNGMTDFDHGIYTYGRFGAIEGNISFHNRGTGIKVGWGNQEGIIVRNNVSFDNNRSALARGKNNSLPGWEGRGISIHRGRNNQVYNNIVWGAHQVGIDIIYDVSDVKIYNNTVYVYGSNGTSHGLRTGGAASNILLRNNIVYQASSNPPSIYNNVVNVQAPGADGTGGSQNIVVENNLFYGINTTINDVAQKITSNKNNIIADPKFVALPPTNATLEQAVNFAKGLGLQSSSPAINKGLTLAEVTTDFNNVRRPVGAGYDIGAFEFGGTPAPTTILTLTPTLPSGSQTPTPTRTPTPRPTSGATPTQPPVGSCRGDINGDTVTDISDYAIMATNFLKQTFTNPKADISGDGVVDISDYAVLASAFLKPCNGTGQLRDVMFKNIPSPTTADDFFELDGVIIGGQRYEESNEIFAYSDKWTTTTSTKYTVNTAWVTFQTNEPEVTLITSRGPSKASRVEVYVDGQLKQVLSLTDATAQSNYQIRVGL